jgi:PAS domain S-box-containing protein
MTTQTEEAVLGNALLKATHSQTINESDQRPADIQFQALTEAIPHIVWTARPDGWLDYYNQRWSDYTGMTIEETQGWGWGPVLHPDDLQPCIHRWAEAVRTGEPYEIEYRFRRASDGTYRWHLGRALPLCDADGQIVKWFGTGTDIDDEKRRVDEAQRTSEDRYRRIVETANEGIWVIDADSRTTFVNQRMADMLGYTVEAMQGRNFFACMDAEGQEIAATIQRRQDGSTEQHDAKFQRQDGTDLWARVAITPFYDQDGLYAGRLAMVSDVTARRRAEEERDRLFSLSLDMMGIAGTDGYFRRLNPAFERTLGWSTAELLGRPFLDFVHPDDQAATIAEVEKLADGQPTISFENRYAHADGSWRWLSWTSTPVAEEGLIFAVAHDTTARKQADEALRDSESLLRVVVANAPVILFALDQDGVYTLSEGAA